MSTGRISLRTRTTGQAFLYSISGTTAQARTGGSVYFFAASQWARVYLEVGLQLYIRNLLTDIRKHIVKRA